MLLEILIFRSVFESFKVGFRCGFERLENQYESLNRTLTKYTKTELYIGSRSYRYLGIIPSLRGLMLLPKSYVGKTLKVFHTAGNLDIGELNATVSSYNEYSVCGNRCKLTFIVRNDYVMVRNQDNGNNGWSSYDNHILLFEEV